jgi:23S rRNA pseudouridine1911/1915/1917 synthase
MSLAESLDILFEDNHCIAVNKPAGWPATHFAGEETVDRLVKAYLKEKYKKPGKVFLGVVHRLDKPVTGVLLFARTSKAAARLSEQFRQGAVEKVYWAVVERSPQASWGNYAPGSSSAGTLEDWLLKDEAAGRVSVAHRQKSGAQHTLTHYQVRARHGGLTLLELRPQTGRKHQLRVQLSSRGFPIYGDRKYGSRHALSPAIALHARSLTFLHPIRHEPITLTAELPKYWRGPFAYLLKEAAE